MNKILKITYAATFFLLVSIPALHFFGAKENWVKLYGWEKKTEVAPFTFANITSRTYQTTFTENYAKNFFLRKSMLKTAYQMRDWMNFGLFHYGYRCSILEGRNDVIYERPYTTFHLNCKRPAGRAKYEKVIAYLKETDAHCRSNGIAFVCFLMPDKPQVYPEYLPVWFDWFWNYSNYDTQAEVGGYLREAGIRVYDVNRHLREKKEKGELTEWVYPPGGTHFNAYGSGLIYEGFVNRFADELGFKANHFVKARRVPEIWSVDDDISNVLNIWHNPRVARNPHYTPEFQTTNKCYNAGSMILFGDCYRDQLALIFRNAGFFASEKIFAAPRGTAQKRETYKKHAKDLKMLVMAFQSFNTGRLDEREAEIRAIITAILSETFDHIARPHSI